VVVQEVHVVDEVLKLQVDTIVKEKKEPIMKEQVLIRDDEASQGDAGRYDLENQFVVQGEEDQNYDNKKWYVF